MNKIITTIFSLAITSLSIAQTVPTNGLIGRFEFEDSINLDATSSNNHLYLKTEKFSFAPPYISKDTGFIGSGLKTTNDLESTLISKNDKYNFTTQFSISVWVYPTDGLLQNAFIVVNRTDQLDVKPYLYNNYALWIDGSTKKVKCTVNDLILESNIAVDLNTWTHIVFTYNAGTAKIFMDNKLEGITTTFASSISTYGTGSNPYKDRLMVGNLHQNGGSSFNSYMDELYLYNRELTAAEVTSIYNYKGKSSNIIKVQTSKINVFPNPANNTLYISNIEFDKPITIINVFGQEVKQLTSTEDKKIIDITDLNNGIYFLKYGIETIKFIKN